MPTVQASHIRHCSFVK